MTEKLQILSGNLYLGQANTSVNEKSFWEMASDPFSPPALLSAKHQRAIQYCIIVFDNYHQLMQLIFAQQHLILNADFASVDKIATG